MTLKRNLKVASCLLSMCIALQLSLPSFAKSGAIVAQPDATAESGGTATQSSTATAQHRARVEEGIVGLRLDPKSGNCTVLEVMENTPSAKAGILKGDEVFEVDGAKTSTLNFDDVINKVRGKAGSKVKLTVMRAGKPFEFSLVRVRETPTMGFDNAGSSSMRPYRREVSELPPAITKKPDDLKPEAINWEPDLRTALLAAKEKKKRVFLYLTAKG